MNHPQNRGEGMRILGISQEWPKLSQDTWTTFRFPRKDRDWAVSELVQVVLHPRRKGGGKLLGVAEIVGKVKRIMCTFVEGCPDILTEEEAKADGFSNRTEMCRWIIRTHGVRRFVNDDMNKLTLRWRERA